MFATLAADYGWNKRFRTKTIAGLLCSWLSPPDDQRFANIPLSISPAAPTAYSRQNQAIDKIQGVIDRSDCQNVFFSTKFKRIKCETSMKTQPGCPSKIENSYTTTLQDLKLDSNITYGVIDCYTLMADNMLGRYVKLTDPDYNN